MGIRNLQLSKGQKKSSTADYYSSSTTSTVLSWRSRLRSRMSLTWSQLLTKTATLTVMTLRPRINKIKISRKKMVKKKVKKQTKSIQALSKARMMKIMMMIAVTRSTTITTTQRSISLILFKILTKMMNHSGLKLIQNRRRNAWKNWF